MGADHWSGGFIDVNDLEAVEKWARTTCRGLTLREAAEALHVKPTIPAVSQAIAAGLPKQAMEVVGQSCESELRRQIGSG